MLSRLAPKLAVAWAERIFLTPPRHDWSEVERPWLASAQRAWLHTNGLPVAAWNGRPMQTYRWGENRRGKVALLHGWAGRATQFHALVEALVADGYEVVAIDAPAHGASPGRQASLLHFAQALARLVRNEGGVDAVIAHSLGGAAAVYAMARYRLPVGKLALLGPAADVAVYARQVGAALDLDAEQMAALRYGMETRLGVQWAELNAVSRAAELRLPGLVIHDRDDKEVDHQAGAAIAAAWPGAQWHLSQGLGHRRLLRDSAVIAQVRTFLAA
ncbi:alpha/beta hydrolase [Chitinimonas sp.]|uniref:alpha/beta hydrolase n=1 Tax=Chitinimonas sp. TaxID=1934313 RepID=UPI002F93B7A0